MHDKKARLKTLLVLLACSRVLAAGPVNADYPGFTAASLQAEESDDC
jgi:hypothetical protein